MKKTKGIGFDTLAIAATAITLFVLISSLDGFERLIRWADGHMVVGVDEVLGAFVIALIAVTVFSCRRLCLLRMQTRTLSAAASESGQSADFFNKVLDSIIDPFIIVAADQTIYRVNKAYADMAGLPAEELEGRSCLDVLECSKSMCEDCLIIKTFRSKDPCYSERPSGPGGDMDTWYEVHTYPILSPSGDVSHVIEYTREITDRKRLEEETRRIMNKLEDLSQRDYLTGLYNRRALMDKADYELGRAGRYGTPLSLMIVDLDLLKDINDTHGHLAGDLAITTVADIITSSARKPDIAGRYGGDEFVIILPMTDMAGARELGNRLIARASEARITLADGLAPRLSLSIGVAMHHEGISEIDELIRRADTALYKAKSGGRARVSVFEADE